VVLGAFQALGLAEGLLVVLDLIKVGLGFALVLTNNLRELRLGGVEVVAVIGLDALVESCFQSGFVTRSFDGGLGLGNFGGDVLLGLLQVGATLHVAAFLLSSLEVA